MKVKWLSRVRLYGTAWTVAYQAPKSMGFSRQEYWSGLPFPSPGDLPNPRIEPGSSALQTDALPSEPLEWSYSHYPILSDWFTTILIPKYLKEEDNFLPESHESSWIFLHIIAGIQWNLPGILGDRTKSTKKKQPIVTDPKKIQN